MTDLYQLAEDIGVEVSFHDLAECKSISIPDHIALDCGFTYGGAEERTHLAHELGHCATGAFYNRYSPYDIKARHERIADRRAILYAVPQNELEEAVRSGYTEIWELSEYFGITEELMKKAVLFYKGAV